MHHRTESIASSERRWYRNIEKGNFENIDNDSEILKILISTMIILIYQYLWEKWDGQRCWFSDVLRLWYHNLYLHPVLLITIMWCPAMLPVWACQTAKGGHNIVLATNIQCCSSPRIFGIYSQHIGAISFQGLMSESCQDSLFTHFHFREIWVIREAPLWKC